MTVLGVSQAHRESISNPEDGARDIVYARPHDGKESDITRLDLIMKALILCRL